ncbi:hypothetical protein LJC55_02155 [Eubacteriales bacterium OttesenSCG-928-N14]|nr:hypothetical protein [Eubacteriales bacterium OttesenSCG-928-N14]
MIIFDEDRDILIENITILLKKEEADQLIYCLKELLSNTEKNGHYHLNNDNYSKEITVALYDKEKDLNNFAYKYQKAILEDD